MCAGVCVCMYVRECVGKNDTPLNYCHRIISCDIITVTTKLQSLAVRIISCDIITVTTKLQSLAVGLGAFGMIFGLYGVAQEWNKHPDDSNHTNTSSTFTCKH